MKVFFGYGEFTEEGRLLRFALVGCKIVDVYQHVKGLGDKRKRNPSFVAIPML